MLIPVGLARWRHQAAFLSAGERRFRFLAFLFLGISVRVLTSLGRRREPQVLRRITITVVIGTETVDSLAMTQKEINDLARQFEGRDDLLEHRCVGMLGELRNSLERSFVFSIGQDKYRIGSFAHNEL